MFWLVDTWTVALAAGKLLLHIPANISDLYCTVGVYSNRNYWPTTLHCLFCQWSCLWPCVQLLHLWNQLEIHTYYLYHSRMCVSVEWLCQQSGVLITDTPLRDVPSTGGCTLMQGFLNLISNPHKYPPSGWGPPPQWNGWHFTSLSNTHNRLQCNYITNY